MSSRLGDIALAGFAVVVIAGAVYSVEAPARSGTPIEPASTTEALPTPTAAPAPVATTEPSVTAAPRSDAAPVLVVGPDLARLTTQLAGVTGGPVESADSAPPAVLAPGALDLVTDEPGTVVLQVVAGSQTSLRTRTAVQAVRQKWPAAKVVVVGPLSPNDRLSAGAIKTACATLGVTFLDPVERGWDTTSATAFAQSIGAALS